MTLLSIDAAIAEVARRFREGGASEAAARSVARALVLAEADGLKGHGLSRIPTYLAMLKAGKIDGQAVPVIRQSAPAVLMVDVANGFAYPAIDQALERLVPLAKQQGLAAAAFHRSNHCGAAGHHVERLAEAGLVALMFANTPAAIAPWGGSKPVFGTNPIAFAAPVPGQAPVVVDLAVSKVARGPIVAAKQKGETIPEGWALDVDGNPTTDAEAALKGTMIPLGDAKGAALALMVEVLGAALMGANLAGDASSFIDDKGGPPGTGQLILALEPAAFGGAVFTARMAALAEAVTDQPGARLPGARRLALRAKAARDGIAVPD